jgi:hypothetical protein
MILPKVRDPRLVTIRRGGNPGVPVAGRAERDWQRRQLGSSIRSLVLEDQARRDAICWSVFTE